MLSEVHVRWWFQLLRFPEWRLLSGLNSSNDTALKWMLQLLVLQHPHVTGKNTVTVKRQERKKRGHKNFLNVFGHCGYSSWCDSNISFQFSWLGLCAKLFHKLFFNQDPVLLAYNEGNRSGSPQQQQQQQYSGLGISGE